MSKFMTQITPTKFIQCICVHFDNNLPFTFQLKPIVSPWAYFQVG